MSISAGSNGNTLYYIHMGSRVHFQKELVLSSDSYGSSLPSSPRNGQIYFMLEG